MRAVVRFNNKTSDAELERLQAAGARGARFSLMSDRPGSVDMIAHAIPRMKKLGWSLVLHVEADHFVDNEAFIRSIPIPTVVDHLARSKPSAGLDQPAFRILLDLLKDDRFWAKIASMVLAMLTQVTPSRSIVSRTLEVSNLGHTTCLPPHMVTV